MVPLYIFLYCSLYVSKNQSLTPNNILFSEKLNLFELLTRTSFALSPTSHSLAPDCVETNYVRFISNLQQSIPRLLERAKSLAKRK